MPCFRTAQLCFSEQVNSFDIFAIYEHCLFEEQLEILEASINYTYKSTAVSAEDNPSILSGKAAHGGVALCFGKTVLKTGNPFGKSRFRPNSWDTLRF